MPSLTSQGLDTSRWQKKRQTKEDRGVSWTDTQTAAANHVPVFREGLQKLTVTVTVTEALVLRSLL